MAIAHSIAVSLWHMLSQGVPYHELGEAYYDQRNKEAKVARLARQLENLTGGTVSVAFLPNPA